MIRRVFRNRPAARFSIPWNFITACPLFLFLPFSCRGAGEELPASAASQGLASALCAFTGMPESMVQNPSCLAFLENAEIQFSSCLLFGLRECSLQSATAGSPLPFGAWGCMAQSLGGALYRENRLAFGFAFVSRNRIAAGVSARILNVQAAGYGGRAAACMDIGWTVRVSEQWSWGACISNCFSSRSGKLEDRLPQCGRTGISFKPCPGIQVLAELDKDPRHALESRWGIETTIARGLLLRCGFGTRPDVFCLGIGAGRGNLRMDYAVSEHPVLGATHHISIRLFRRTQNHPEGKGR